MAVARSVAAAEVFRRWLVLGVLAAVVVALGGCSAAEDAVDEPASTTSPANPTSVGSTTSTDTTTGVEATNAAVPELEPIRVGAEVLADDDFARLAGLRVGAVLNQSSTVDDQPLLDVLAAADQVDLVAAFAPEHGVRGAFGAGAAVDETVDPATGVLVHSLYGDTRKPTADMLAGLDVLVFDLQDVGVRAYTYISTMGLVLQAAAEADLPVLVLDRPNPLGGRYLDGPLLEAAQTSFVGQYPIPSAHGLTTGELALALQGEGWLPGLDGLTIEVIEVEGWRREQAWAALDRTWVPPSPSLPTASTAAAYPGTVFFEATELSIGRGTDEPFSTVGAPWVDAAALVAALDEVALPGVRFEAVEFTPEALPAVPAPPFEGQRCQGVRIVIDDVAVARPVSIGVHLLAALRGQSIEQGRGEPITRPDFFDLLAGTDELRLGLESGAPTGELIEAWSGSLAAFEALRLPYLLYD